MLGTKFKTKMIKTHTTSNHSIFLKEISLENVSDQYLNWLNDPIINVFTEFKKTTWTKSLLKEYVTNSIKNSSEYMFCVFDKSDNTHVGNVRLHSIDIDRESGHIGILIGNTKKTGKGIGTQAISLISRFAFDELNLKEVYAGVLVDNIASIKVFRKNEFIQMKNNSKKSYSFMLKNNS